jgi:uncharacterized protein (UPF0332 family)
MRLTDEEIDVLINLRLEKSKATFAEVSIQINNELWRTAANRLYYACFYAASALLTKDRHDARTHNEVFSMLGYHYVKENKIRKEQSDVYRKLFNLRQTDDYDDWAIITEDDVKPLVVPAKDFIETVETLILSNQATG